MTRRSHSLLLLAPVLVMTMSGCGIWDAWTYRMNHHAPLGATYDEADDGPILPGHSTDRDQFNQNYAPYSSAPTERLTPPPVPPSRADISAANTESSPGDDVAAHSSANQGSAKPESMLIKTLKSPRLFTPEGVRNIYDRFRNADSDQPPTIQPPSGPIAQNRISEMPMRNCQYTEEKQLADSPVQLGLPEADGAAQGATTHQLQVERLDDRKQRTSIMQVCPSSFRHPLLADPTGVPYASR